MFLSSCYTLKRLAKTYVQRRAKPVSPSGVNGETLVFIATEIVANVAEVESSSTFRETCLATKVQKRFTKPTMLHGATPAETCFASSLHTFR